MSMLQPGGRAAALVIVHAVRDFNSDAMSIYAAALAYRVLFALFPFLIFLVALLGFFDVPQFFDWLQQQAATLVPAQAMEPVTNVIDEVRQPRGGLLSFGIVLAIWSASFAVLMLMDALNVAYGVEKPRPTWKRMLLAVAYTVGLAAMLVVAAGFMLVGPAAAGWAAEHLGIEQLFVTVWNWMRWPIAVLLLMLAISLVYRVAPASGRRPGFLTPGAIMAVAIWIAASLGFGYYVRNFADYSATYGSLGAVIVLLFYFYISAAVLLFGAEINAVLQGRRADGHGERRVRAAT